MIGIVCWSIGFVYWSWFGVGIDYCVLGCFVGLFVIDVLVYFDEFDFEYYYYGGFLEYGLVSFGVGFG